MQSFYDVLGVSRNASTDEIKRAYRRLAHEHHPDKGGDHSRFKEINEAYQVLSDPQKRAQYDQFGSVGPDFGAGPGFEGAQGFGFGGFEGFGGLGDIFETFFSQAFSTVQTELPVTIAQAVLGDNIRFNFRGESIDFKLPPGTRDGQTFRFRGKGMPHSRGRGDLMVIIRIQIPHRLSREERELFERLKEIQKP